MKDFAVGFILALFFVFAVVSIVQEFTASKTVCRCSNDCECDKSDCRCIYVKKK